MRFILQLSLILFSFTGSTQGIWITLPDFPGTPRYAATGFALNGKGYVITGYESSPALMKDTWEYDPATFQWTQKADFPGNARWYASSFSINGKGYLGFGETATDFWEYDPVGDTWTQKNNFPGPARAEAVAFSIGNKGYVGTGAPYGTSNFMKDFWEYNPGTDSWTQLQDFPGGPRGFATAFVIGQKAYVGTGTANAYTNVYSNDLWEFNPVTNSWTQKQNMPIPRTNAVSFSVGNYGYTGMGTSINGQFVFPQDMWRYNPQTNQWDSVAPLPYYKCNLPVTFSLNNVAYVVTGHPDGKKLWLYRPGAEVVTSVRDNNHENMTAYYHLADHEIRVIGQTGFETTNIDLYDIAGKLLGTWNFAKNETPQIIKKELAKGIYLMHFRSEAGGFSKRLAVY